MTPGAHFVHYTKAKLFLAAGTLIKVLFWFDLVPSGSIWFLMVRYSYGSLLFPYGSLEFIMVPKNSLGFGGLTLQHLLPYPAAWTEGSSVLFLFL